MEIFEGQKKTLILYDKSPFSRASLLNGLYFQAESKEFSIEDRVIILDISDVEQEKQTFYISIAKDFAPQQIYLFNKKAIISEELHSISNKSIFYKGPENSIIGQFLYSMRDRKHKTWMRFDLSAIQHNIKSLQTKIPKTTKTLVMVKASSYGSGDIRIPHFLQQIGVNYLGVAFVDEGVILRANKINLPIFVTNTEVNSFDEVVTNQLEPSIFSLEQLQSLRTYLVKQKIINFPIHLSVETGMNRLGFDLEHFKKALAFIAKSPQIFLKGVFSHLADADNTDTTFTEQQINLFKTYKTITKSSFQHEIIFHLLNSEGVSKFGKEAGFGMVRLGIGIYGYTSLAKTDGLLPTIRWNTTVSQVKIVKKGDTIGYGRSFKAKKEMKIATLLVGYADGFGRKLSNGVGSVIIGGKNCPVVGNVCMDMTMVDVTNIAIEEGDSAEIIGTHITMEMFADRLDMIIHEAMTKIDKRVAKHYLLNTLS